MAPIIPRIPQGRTSKILTEGRRLFEQELSLLDVYGTDPLDDATWTVDEVAKLFGGRTASWLRWAERGHHLGTMVKSVHGTTVRSVVTTASGRQLATRRGPDSGVRHYNLVDLLEMVLALRQRPADSGGFSEEEADALLLMLFARAYAYRASLASRTPPPPRDVETEAG